MDNAERQLGQKIKEARIAAGFSVADISSYLTDLGFKASVKTIYSWERDNSQPTPDAFLYMCDRYGITDPLEYFGYGSIPSDADAGEDKLVTNYRSLNEEGQFKLVDYSDDLVTGGRYKKHDKSILGTKEA